MNAAPASNPRRRAGLDARALFNPAFVAVLLGKASRGHLEESDTPLPFALAFLIAPLVLHAPTRTALPRRVNARLGTWAENHPLVRSELRLRAPGLTSVTPRAIRLGLRTEVLKLEATALAPGDVLARVSAPAEPDAKECWESAVWVGRWLSRSGPPQTTFALLGVKP